MKIIELLNKIANDEEVPKKIKYDGQIYTYSNCRYKTQDGYSDLLGTKNMFYSGVLNYEVEIIEDKPKFEVDEKGFIHTNSGAWKGRKIDIEFAKTLNWLIEKSSSND